jgi:hypothetical protein
MTYAAPGELQAVLIPNAAQSRRPRGEWFNVKAEGSIRLTY